MSIARFGILRHQPYPERTEHINIGVVVFMPDGAIIVRMASNLRRLRSFDPSADLDVVRSQEQAIPELLRGMDVARARNLLSRLGPWRLSQQLGALEFQSPEELDDAIDWALATSCEPGKTIATRERPIVSRLYVDLKRTFDAFGWLGKAPNAIDEHLIVARYPVSPEEGLIADFALRNGSLQVMETIDLRDGTNPAMRRAQAQAKALLMSVAADVEDDVQTIAVVAGSAGESARPTLRLLKRFSKHVYAYESAADMQQFFARCGAALGRPLLEPPLGN